MPQAAMHADLWLCCLGKDQPAEMYSLRGTLSTLSSLIDRGLSDDEVRNALSPQLRDEISKLPERFTFGVGGGEHRALFHWGLSVSRNDFHTAATTQPLRGLIEQRKRKMEGLSATERERLAGAYCEYILDEWCNRRDKFAAGANALFPGKAALVTTSCSPMAVILYEIHILADFLDEMITQLGPLEEHLLKELVAGGLEKLPQSDRRDALVKNLKKLANEKPWEKERLVKELAAQPAAFQNMFQNKLSHDETRRKALQALIILRESLPAVLADQYGESFQGHGIPLGGEGGLLKTLLFWRN